MEFKNAFEYSTSDGKREILKHINYLITITIEMIKVT
jgi:hypothetical protein